MFSHISVKVYCHGSFKHVELAFPPHASHFFAPSRDTTCASKISLNLVLPWESTISTYGLSKILQVSCHVACNKKFLFKYVWFISVEKINFIRSCDMEAIKATDCIIKIHITKWQYKVMFFCIKILCIQP